MAYIVHLYCVYTGYLNNVQLTIDEIVVLECKRYNISDVQQGSNYAYEDNTGI